MTIFAYLRDRVVIHLSTSGNEPLLHAVVVPVPEGMTVEIGYSCNEETGEFSPPEAPQIIPPTIGAIAFQRLFTRAERVKARELRATDPELDDIWKQIEDPRTDVVVMALPSIQEDVEYTLDAVKIAGLAIDVAARKAEILSGQIR